MPAIRLNAVLPLRHRRSIAASTSIWTAQGWLFVAAVIDLFSRRVIGLIDGRNDNGSVRHRHPKIAI